MTKTKQKQPQKIGILESGVNLFKAKENSVTCYLQQENCFLLIDQRKC